MGWKGTLRSINAAANRAERERSRVQRLAARETERNTRHEERIVSELDSDRRKVEAFQERVRAKPVQAWKMRYQNGAWVVDPYSDRTGKVRFQLRPEYISDQVAIEPREGNEGKVHIRLLACCITPQATYFAVSLRSQADSARISLVNKSTPERGRMALLAGGITYHAIDDTTNGIVHSGADRVGIVAFEPFRKDADAFEIVIAPRTKKSQTLRFKVTGSAIASTIRAFPEAPSLLDRFDEEAAQLRDRVRQDVAEANQEIQKQARSASSGCLLLLLLLTLSTVGVLAMLA